MFILEGRKNIDNSTNSDDFSNGNWKKKVRAIILALAFSGIIFSLSQNDFNFNFSALAKTQLVNLSPYCNPSLERNSFDDNETSLEKIELLIGQNIDIFQEMAGFRELSAEETFLPYKKEPIPTMVAYFSGVSSTDRKIPEKICGYKVSVVFK